jgi:microsomal dipeptidase-like Zn-dependent dipeptidase
MAKVIGAILVVVGVVGILFSVVLAWGSWQTVDTVVETTDSVDAAFGDTLDFLAESLEAVNTEEMQVGLEDRVVEIKAQINETVVSGNDTLRLGRAALLLLFLWLGLAQLVPLYIGADLLADGRLGSRLLSKSE